MLDRSPAEIVCRLTTERRQGYGRYARGLAQTIREEFPSGGVVIKRELVELSRMKDAHELTTGNATAVEQEHTITGNFDVFVDDKLVHSKKQFHQGRCDSPAEVERVIMAIEDAVQARAAPPSASGAATGGKVAETSTGPSSAPTSTASASSLHPGRTSS